MHCKLAGNFITLNLVYFYTIGKFKITNYKYILKKVDLLNVVTLIESIHGKLPIN